MNGKGAAGPGPSGPFDRSPRPERGAFKGAGWAGPGAGPGAVPSPALLPRLCRCRPPTQPLRLRTPSSTGSALSPWALLAPPAYPGVSLYLSPGALGCPAGYFPLGQVCPPGSTLLLGAGLGAGGTGSIPVSGGGLG
ncbi:DAZ-associated protein 2 [Oenanthe melanoleuca]|uniref:DAZ-associated protein 2 n=1 Tax=Oenanthe melanoleuca TaxID=2939378 RepID=UPI0024C128B7|nr:DAZ-associated protein 2 [Oenanthe melanoleuca]